MMLVMVSLGPSIHKFDDELIHSGLSAALGHEQIGLESFGLELMTERLTAERLGPNGVNNMSEISRQNRSVYLRIEALSLIDLVSVSLYKDSKM
jgi:hypothetical protein